MRCALFRLVFFVVYGWKRVFLKLAGVVPEEIAVQYVTDAH